MNTTTEMEARKMNENKVKATLEPDMGLTTTATGDGVKRKTLTRMLSERCVCAPGGFRRGGGPFPFPLCGVPGKRGHGDPHRVASIYC